MYKQTFEEAKTTANRHAINNPHTIFIVKENAGNHTVNTRQTYDEMTLAAKDFYKLVYSVVVR